MKVKIVTILLGFLLALVGGCGKSGESVKPSDYLSEEEIIAGIIADPYSDSKGYSSTEKTGDGWTDLQYANNIVLEKNKYWTTRLFTLDNEKQYRFRAFSQTAGSIIAVLARVNGVLQEVPSLRRYINAGSSGTTIFSKKELPERTTAFKCALIARTNGSFNARLSQRNYFMAKYRVNNFSPGYHVWQGRVPKKYIVNDANPFSKNYEKGVCDHAKHKRNTGTEIRSNGLCGPASLLNAYRHIIAPNFMRISNDKEETSYKLADIACRIWQFSGYDFTATNLSQLKVASVGTSTYKGHLTNWSDCSEKTQSRGALHVTKGSWSQQEKRDRLKSFLEDHISKKHPIVVGVMARVNRSNLGHPSNSEDYLRGNGKAGHIFTLTGLNLTWDKGGSIWYFTDPLFDNPTNWPVDYTVLLDSILENGGSALALF
jgi:hypothetical protein